MSQNQERFLGVPVVTLNREALFKDIEERIGRGAQSTLIAINPEKVMTARKNPTLSRLIEEATYQIPDGTGILLASRLKKGVIRERITGIDTMDALVRLAWEREEPVFLYGAEDAVVKEAAVTLKKRYLGLKIAGTMNGFQKDEEKVVEAIRESGAVYLFIAKGSPRQELWIEQYMKDLPDVKVFQGVGGSFDVLAGKVKRAPAGFQKLGLEWLYRLMKEPKRIRRQLLLPQFLIRVMMSNGDKQGS
ncbi:WecB/TagA/CpsF family glycosyltransferase [Salisediminibacterium selenitireducens]|uniref:N-acetylglucosaminyldiphosphoundecaprenol N-acetyl-beta-D-mannosaminyltransferase n=1 Tax=Bacillus selenitireducens (strain ATCC 700615 / DSM 15326 / MLS10) TaxID=439292 RepID=D6Y043_BACIE|nr:WecB/TagA/CpsF family glycosyltransferase [Salisediminibacterium selenitireducens]ADI00545.1 glycosyl transferase, WecB/TagA/CpsF family [[Bacillus] selenitireducens MLS10]